jgi:hypothetical protein
MGRQNGPVEANIDVDDDDDDDNFHACTFALLS